MKRLKTSDGKAVSLGNSARRVRSGTHADALQYTDDDAGDLMAVPFTEEEIRHWRNAKKLSYGTFTNMASVEEACKAVQVACFLDDQSPTINSLAAKLLDACIFEYPGVSKKDTFNLCTESADILKAVFSSKRICDASQMAQLIHTLYETLGFEISVDFPYPYCEKYPMPPPKVTGADLHAVYTFSCRYLSWLLFQFNPSNFSKEYGIRREARGLAGHEEVQKKWADFVTSSNGFVAERKEVLENLVQRAESPEPESPEPASPEPASPEPESSEPESSDSFTSEGCNSGSENSEPENSEPDSSVQRRSFILELEALTSWEAVPEDFFHDIYDVHAIRSSKSLMARMKAAFALNIAVLAPILDAQLAVGANSGVLVLTRDDSALINTNAVHPDYIRESNMGKVMSNVSRLMDSDLRSLTNLKVVKFGGSREHRPRYLHVKTWSRIAEVHKQGVAYKKLPWSSNVLPWSIFTHDYDEVRVSEGVQVFEWCSYGFINTLVHPAWEALVVTVPQFDPGVSHCAHWCAKNGPNHVLTRLYGVCSECSEYLVKESSTLAGWASDVNEGRVIVNA